MEIRHGKRTDECKRTRWDEPPPHSWRQQQYPARQSPYQQISNYVWIATNPVHLNNALLPPSTEDDVPGPAEERPQNDNGNQTFERSRPPQVDRPWRKHNNFRSSERWRPPSVHRLPNRPPRGRRQPFHQKIFIPPHRYREDESYFQNDYFVDSHVVLSNDNTWVEPDKVMEETPPAKTDEEKRPLLGSNEEREKTVKKKADWLKNQLKNKDLSDVEKRLQQMRRQKTSEQPFPKETNEKTLYIPASTDNSALEADSIEIVKKNLSADVLPDESNLLNSLLKENEMSTKTSRCVDQNRVRVDTDERSHPSDLIAMSVLKKTVTKLDRNVVRKQPVAQGKKRCYVERLETIKYPDYSQIASKETVPLHSSFKDRLHSPCFQSVSKEIVPSRSSHTARLNSEYSPTASKETVPSSHSSPTARPNLTVSRSKTSEGLPNQEKKKENLLECVSKLAGIPKMKDMGQLKSLIENPRPGKFEYYLKEQIKRYRLASCRAVHLSGEPFTNIENVDKPIKVEDTSEEYLLSSLGKWSESINMEDLPFAIVQELGELLDLDFSGQADSGEEVHVEVNDQVREELPVQEADPLITEQSSPVKPEIRIKDFARFRMPTPVELALSPRGDNAAVRKQEPDTTVTPSASSHPLDGPSLMASVSVVAEQIPPVIPVVSCSDAANNFPSPPPQRATASARGRRINTLPQDIFFSAETYERKRGKSKKKSDEVVLPLVDADANSSSNPKAASKQGRKGTASKSPDSTNLLESEQDGSQTVGSPQSERGRFQVSRKKMSTNSSMSELTDEEISTKSMDEAEVLSRLREICVQIKKLEKEKAHLYTLLPLGRENLKRKNNERSSDESDGEAVRQKIFAEMVAGLQQSSKAEKETSGSSSTRKKVRKRSVKKARCIVSPDNRVELRQENRVEPSRVVPVAKGTLAFFMSDITLTCKKNMLPEDIGIITQIKVIRKSILVASANGKIHLINSSTGKLKKTFDLGVFAVKCFCLAQTKDRDGVLLLGGTEDGRLHCFKLLSGEKINECKISDNINCMDGRDYEGQWRIYIGSKSGSVSMYNVASEKVESLTCENGSIYGITCTNEGARKIIICSSSKNGIEVRDAKTALMTRRIVTFCDGETLGASEYKVAIDVNINKVCYSKIGEVHITEFANPGITVRHKISTHVSCMGLYQGVLYVGCKDGTIRRIDVRTNEVLEPLTGKRENVVCMDIAGDKVILARKGGVFDIIDLNKNTQNEDSVEEL